MKQYFLIVMAIFTLTSGCMPRIQSPTPPAFVDELSSTLTQQASIEATIPATFTPEPMATTTLEGFQPIDREVIFRDDFVERLEDGWEWVNEDTSTWSLSIPRGSLQIQSEFGSIQFGSAKNLLLRNAPQGDFMVETSINFSASEADQFAGVVLFESEKDFLQSGLGYCSEASGCIQAAFYVDSYENGRLILPREFFTFEDSIIAIQIVVRDGNLQIFTSPNGLVWYRTIFQKQLTFTPLKVGLFTGQNSDSALVPATFEYFEISIPK